MPDKRSNVAAGDGFNGEEAVAADGSAVIHEARPRLTRQRAAAGASSVE